MVNNKLISIETIKDNPSEYIIKDVVGINLGRVFIIEFDKKNKNVLIRLKFYKKTEEYFEHILESLDILTDTFFCKKDLFKINLIVSEEFDFSSIIEKGFKLEGILKDTIYCGVNNYKSEFLFGITIEQFRIGKIKNRFSLKGNNIELKILTPEDSQVSLEYCIRNKNHLKPYEPSRDKEYFTLAGQKNNLTQSYKEYLNGKEVSFGIFKGNNLIGKIRFSNIVLGILKSCTVGYSMDEVEQGKGYMKEALKLSMRYVFEVLELHRIEASTLLDNEKSQRVLKSCGFKELGVNEKYLFINGEWRDHIMFYRTCNWKEQF
ncbi:GNAT family protein [Hathewaya histolytica]|uniref:Putative ribosomal-protein (S5)-alanine N-acetyltransferase n=1 Tax=Hathewaya histolytica TaxID=1498 RepID=A0A4U9QT37_HATHI|nr:GNAT family protein [Hathewaya histolytica]VTQ81764.1 putative ribosomal-protein (S5)-alanine N-acetyltransferase [Hathewaya histolytica]